MHLKNLAKVIDTYQKELTTIENEIDKLPVGYLSKRESRYYHTIGRKDKGITKNPEVIKQLCRKRYLSARKEQLIRNLALLPNHTSDFDNRTAKELIKSLPAAYQGFPISHFYHPAIEKWVTTNYPKHPYPPGPDKPLTKNGIRVRSKSELLIATQFEECEIPYHYETKITLNNKVEYPDFIIKNPFTNKTIIWEHFGATHLSGYEGNMSDKMNLYLSNGYVANDTFVCTFEFQVQNAKRIQEIIENVILGSGTDEYLSHFNNRLLG